MTVGPEGILDMDSETFINLHLCHAMCKKMCFSLIIVTGISPFTVSLTIIKADFKVSVRKILHQHTLGMFGIHSDLQDIKTLFVNSKFSCY